LLEGTRAASRWAVGVSGRFRADIAPRTHHALDLACACRQLRLAEGRADAA
jgi:hypothetical protein